MKYIFMALLFLVSGLGRSEVVARAGADDILRDARMIAIVRVDSVYRTDISDSSPCRKTREKYTVKVVVERLVDGESGGDLFCFDVSPALDQVILVAVGNREHPLWVRSFWLISRNVTQSRRHIRVGPEDSVDELARVRFLIEERCVEERCEFVKFYPYILLDDLISSVVKMRAEARRAH